MATSEPVPAINSTSEPEEAELDLLSIASPSDLDHRIFWAKRAGKSIKQLARSQNLTEADIRQAIFRVELYNARLSSEYTGTETRRIFLENVARISDALAEALVATKMVGKKTVMIDKETGDIQTLEETIERPDHEVRLRGMAEARQLVAVVQPKDPAVVVNNTNNTQNNLLNAPQLGAGGNGHGALTSPEAVIRAIVGERQKALAAPVAPSMMIPTSKPVLEGVPVMAIDPEQPEGEYEDEQISDEESEDMLGEDESDGDEDDDLDEAPED